MGKKILCYGSLNIDNVYKVPHFVRPGETLAADSFARFAGGKGLNQAIALGRAKANVHFTGCVGKDGLWLRDVLTSSGIHTRDLTLSESIPTGNALIQVNRQGENCILLFPGANHANSVPQLEKAMDQLSEEDIFLLQNETNIVPEAMRLAKERGLILAFNPSPLTENITSYPLELVDLFILNEIEAAGLSEIPDTSRALQSMRDKFPHARIVLTLGSKGVSYSGPEGEYFQEADQVKVVDTTAAGDTFTGYFLAEYAKAAHVTDCLRRATKAAGLCVSRAGASDSIPTADEIGQA
jgi:ribokinase